MLASTTPILSAQETGAIAGRAFDSMSREPIEDLAVEVSGSGLSTVTDAQGAFRIRNVPAGGPVVLRLDHGAYGPRTDTISVRAGEVALLRISVAGKTTPLEPVVVEVMSRGASPERADPDVITRDEIEELAGAYPDLLGLLNREIPGIRVSNRGAAPARFCVEFQGVAKSLQDEPGLCHYPLLIVDQSRVDGAVLESVLQTLEVDDIQRIEMIRPAEAGVEYGTGSQYGVLMIRTRKGGQRAVRTAPSPPELRPSSTYNWAIEPQGHPTYRTLGATFVGNAAGLALGLWIGSQCMDFDRQHMDFFHSRCGDWTTAGSRLAAVGLPIVGSTLAARWAGGTEVSQGRWKKTAGVAAIVLVPGYILAASGLGEEGSAAETGGEIMISVGVPVAATLVDRFFRNIRSGDGG